MSAPGVVASESWHQGPVPEFWPTSITAAMLVFKGSPPRMRVELAAAALVVLPTVSRSGPCATVPTSSQLVLGNLVSVHSVRRDVRTSQLSSSGVSRFSYAPGLMPLRES